tara:strand:- start:86 stop:2236 length:2151 start_codon:yes stop_codon:yes gene_type:complete
MLARKSPQTIQEAILQKYRDAYSASAPERSIDERAIKMFDVLVEFISHKKWEYMPDPTPIEDPITDFTDDTVNDSPAPVDILDRHPNQLQSVNCFDLTNIFIQLCKLININNAKQHVYDFTPIQTNEKPIPNTNMIIQCFDKKACSPNNQVLFDKHSVAKVNGRYYDLVFKVHYKNINETACRTQIARMAALISSNNQEAVMRQLERNDFDITQTFQGYTILHWSVDKKLYDLTYTILEKYPRLAHVKTDDSLNPAALPIEIIEDTDSLLFYLLATKHDREFVQSVKDKIHNTASNEEEVYDETDNLSIQSIENMISSGLSLRDVDAGGNTLLHNAILSENNEVIDYLLRVVPDLANTEDEYGCAPIEYVNNSESFSLFKKLAPLTDPHYSQKKLFDDLRNNLASDDSPQNHIQHVRNALANGLLINNQDSCGFTMLHDAARHKRPELARMLITSGADVSIKDTAGLKAIDYCSQGSNVYDLLAHFTNEKDAPPCPITLLNKAITMIAHDDLDGIKNIVLSNELDINLQDKNGNTMLHKATEYENIEIVTWLTKQKASLHIMNEYDEKPLELCAFHSTTNVRNILERYNQTITQRSRRHSRESVLSETGGILFFSRRNDKRDGGHPQGHTRHGDHSNNERTSPPPPPHENDGSVSALPPIHMIKGVAPDSDNTKFPPPPPEEILRASILPTNHTRRDDAPRYIGSGPNSSTRMRNK